MQWFEKTGRKVCLIKCICHYLNFKIYSPSTSEIIPILNSGLMLNSRIICHNAYYPNNHRNEPPKAISHFSFHKYKFV